MAMRVAVLFVTLLAVAADPRPTNKEWKAEQAAADKKAADATADQAKMGAVDKVVAMLDTLTQKVLAEGEAEAASYNKFACFCKTIQKEKKQAIKDETDAKAQLTADINKLMDGRKADDKAITGLEKDIEDTNDEMKTAADTNAKEMKAYNVNKADLSKAIQGIEDAMKTLKASKPSLLQLKAAGDTVQEMVAMADVLGLETDTSLLQQAPEVEMENYKFHSGGVIGTLEKLQKTFREKKNTADEEEVKRLAAHDMDTQEKTDKVKAKTLELQQTQKSRSDKIADIATKSQSLSNEAAQLIDDSEYLNNLYSTCKKKADTWDQRSKVRADELSAITAATTIVKGAVSEKTASGTIRFAQRGVSIRLAEAVARDEDAMDSLEEAAEEKEAPSTFLQRRSVTRHLSGDPVREISDLLRRVGGKTKSTLLTSLASEISTEKPKGMEKIKTLIEELIKRLQAEASNEATQKGWCDKATAVATTKREATSQNVDELNDALAQLEADRALLKEKLEKLAAAIQELKDAQKKADDLRKDEKQENTDTVKEAKEGQTAVKSAIDILDKFYKKSAGAEVKASKLIQQKTSQEPPDAGFDNGEAYGGDQSSATGVLGMLDVILSDFARTIKETEKAETESEQDYQAFTAQTKTSQTEQEALQTARKKEKATADSDDTTKRESLTKNTDLLSSTIEELLELKKSCVDTAMSYEERVARREDEMAALTKALCILEAYAKNGAGGVDVCS